MASFGVRGFRARNKPPKGLAKLCLRGLGFKVGPTMSGGGQWTPAALYANGEQGGWYETYDPILNNQGTMFQDAAGTTPVTAVGQPVGLWLDKRKVATELYTNAVALGAISFNSNISLNGEIITCTSTGVFNYGVQFSNLPAIVGENYLVVFTITTNSVSKNIFTQIGSRAVNTGAALGAHQSIALNAADTSQLLIFATPTGAGETFTVTVSSIKKISGNHLSQATTTARPILKALYNKLTKSEQLTDAAWTKTDCTVVAGAADPQGGATAFTMTATLATAQVSQATTIGAGSVGVVYLRRRTGTGTVDYWNSAAKVPLNLTNAWTPFTLTYTGATSFAASLYLGTPGDQIDIWHPDIRAANDATLNLPAYQRVNTTSDYDTAGFPHYLEFDGVDDKLVSSANSGITGPAFFWSLGYEYNVFGANQSIWDSTRYKGGGAFATSALRFTAYTAKDYDDPGYALAASTPYVSGGQFDTSFGFTPRKNGVARTLITGTGDAVPADGLLRLGCNFSSAEQFNGRLYTFILRGANTSSGDQLRTDQYIGNKMGMTL